jgi:hypothetical protein
VPTLLTGVDSRLARTNSTPWPGVTRCPGRGCCMITLPARASGRSM